MKVKVAVAQMNCRMGDVRANIQTIKRLSGTVVGKGIDFLCFPELATTGYSLTRS